MIMESRSQVLQTIRTKGLPPHQKDGLSFSITDYIASYERYSIAKAIGKNPDKIERLREDAEARLAQVKRLTNEYHLREYEMEALMEHVKRWAKESGKHLAYLETGNGLAD